MYGRSHCALFVKAYEATKPVAPGAVRKSIAEWAENDDLCDRLNALFEKTNDPEDFLSFAKIQFKVQQDGCTVSKPLIGRALNRKKSRSNRRGANVYQRTRRGRVTGYEFSGWRSCEELSLRHCFPIFERKTSHVNFINKPITCITYNLES